MSESFYVDLQVGGTISQANATTVLDIINENFEDGTFNIDFDNPIDDKMEGSGWISYNEYQEIERKLRDMNVTFTLTMSPKEDYEGIKCYNFPEHNLSGETSSDNNGHPITRNSDVTPLLNLMMHLLKGGTKTLATRINDEPIKDLVKNILKNPDDMILILEDHVKNLVPDLPHVPKLIITKN
jgi:hypothetical protein